MTSRPEASGGLPRRSKAQPSTGLRRRRGGWLVEWLAAAALCLVRSVQRSCALLRRASHPAADYYGAVGEPFGEADPRTPPRIAPLVAAFLLAGCFTTTGMNRFQPNLYSVDQEVGLGREMTKAVEQETTIVRHHALAQLVQAIGKRLQDGAPDPEFGLYPFTFKVVDSSEVNAFSLPGGPIYVNLGLVELADTEDELAGVIAHEMSHVAARHATERVTMMQLSQIAIMTVLSTVGGAPVLAMEGGRLGFILGILRYTRGMESEADEMAVRVMTRAGYDPWGMVGMFEKLERERRAEPILLERLMSSHPLPDDRIAEVKRLCLASGATKREDRTRAAFAKVKVPFERD